MYGPRNTLLVAAMVMLGMACLTAQQARHSLFGTIEVNKSDIVIHGAHLQRVEVWAIPTGTGITPDEYVLLGKAKRTNRAGSDEVWLFRMSSCAAPLAAAEVFIKAFSMSGKLIGKKSLPSSGASEVCDVLCGQR